MVNDDEQRDDEAAESADPMDLPPAEPHADLLDQDGDAANMPRVQARWRCGDQAYVTDDAPFGAMILPGRKPGQFLVSAAGTPEEVWGMVKALTAYAQDTGVIAMAKLGVFGDKLPGKAQIITEREYPAPPKGEA